MKRKQALDALLVWMLTSAGAATYAFQSWNFSHLSGIVFGFGVGSFGYQALKNLIKEPF